MNPSDMTEHYCVRVAGESLRFSAAHFITFADGDVEPLHGHDYRVAAEIAAPLGPHGYVIDFLTVERALKEMIHELDHRTLLPGRHPVFRVDVRPSEIEVAMGTRRWVLPREDCVLLPIANTTAETIAGHLARGLYTKLAERAAQPPASVRVEVHESPGFAGVCTLNSTDSDPPTSCSTWRS